MHSSNTAGATERTFRKEEDLAGEAGEAVAYLDKSGDAPSTQLEELEAEILALRGENDALRAALEIARDTMLRMLNHNNELLAGAISVLHDRAVIQVRDTKARRGRTELAPAAEKKLRDNSEASVAAECISAADLTEWL